MNKSTLAAELSPDYVWAFPGSPVRIHLSLSVVSKLREQLFTGFDPGSAKEIGGLLLGKAQAGRVDITDIRSFSATEDGYIAWSSADKVHLKSLLQKHQSDHSLPSIVGYFRSDLRGGIRLSEEDLTLSRELFSDPEQVFLIISGQASGTPTAGFFFWDRGSIFAEASFMQFPLDERLLATPRPSILPPAPSVLPPGQNDVSDVPIPHARSKSSYRFILWALGLFLLALAAGVAVYRPFKPATQQSTVAIASPVSSTSMSLSAVRTGQNVTITWDSRLPAIAEARIGVLTIKAGSSQAEFPMTKAQLQISKMIYVTEADRLELTLEVFSPNGISMRESIMLAFTQQQPTKSRSRMNATIVEAPKLEEIRPPAVDSTPTPVRTFTAIAPAPTRNAPERSVITDVAPPAQVSTLDPAGIKAPDFLAPAVKQVEQPKFPENTVITSQPPPLQPPVPIRQVRPVVPANVNAMLKRRVDVQVRVSIDQNGKVVNAEPVVPRGGLNQYLGTSAANTARLWTFQPARRDNTPIASELLLTFTFGPADKQE